MNKKSSWKKWGKPIGIVLLVIVCLLIIIQLIFSFYAESFIRQKIESSINDSSSGLVADIGDLKLTTLQRELSLEDIRIKQKPETQQTDSAHKQPLPFDSLTVQSISVSGVHILNYLFGKALIIDNISVKTPVIYARKAHNSSSSKKDSNSPKMEINEKIYHAINSFAHSITVDHFKIKDFTAVYDTMKSVPAPKGIYNFSLQLSNIQIDSAWSQGKPTLPVQSFSGRADSLNWPIDPKLYDLKIKDLWFSSSDSAITADSVSLKPKLPRLKFSRSVGHEVDRINLNISQFRVFGLNYFTLINDQKLFANSLKIGKSKLKVFHDKRRPAAPETRKKLYQLMFRELKFPVKMDSVVVEDLDIKYEEHKNLVPDPGYVTFEHTHATIKNLNNIHPYKSGAKPITMHAESDVMGVGHLDAKFTFPPVKSGTHYVKGKVGRMPIKALNPALKYLANIEIQSGIIHSLNFSMELGPKESNGKLNLHYTNLKLKMIEFEGEHKTNDKWLKSLIANKIVIKKDNKPPLRKGDISFERVPYKSIFNYWWKSLLSGLKSSVGL